jgi:uncharacterized protein (TIGR02391 family)
MLSKFKQFETIARKAHSFDERAEQAGQVLHPFDQRNIHPRLQPLVKTLFDDGHYAQATFEAFKFVDKEVQRFSGISESGYKLFMRAFAENTPVILLTKMSNASEKDEQEGYKFIFSGSALAIRNPRGHEYGIKDDPDKCLDHLSLASMLLRRLDEAGYK